MDFKEGSFYPIFAPSFFDPTTDRSADQCRQQQLIEMSEGRKQSMRNSDYDLDLIHDFAANNSVDGDDSCYKRLIANGQERRRMHRLNVALEELRKVIPAQFHGYSRRLSKIKTLRTAISYIAGLKLILEEGTFQNGDGQDELDPRAEYYRANYSLAARLDKMRGKKRNQQNPIGRKRGRKRAKEPIKNDNNHVTPDGANRTA